MACRWNPNLFFDFSGSLLKYRSSQYIGSLLWWTAEGPYSSPDKTSPWQKILFGSDVSPSMVSDAVNDYDKLFCELKLPLSTGRRSGKRMRKKFYHKG